jgi:hypothetical protein
MGWSKQQIVGHAFTQLGLASYFFNITPQELQDAVQRLDAMIASWDAQGIKISYNLSSLPQNSSLNTDSGLPDIANEAVFLSLAIALAPSYGVPVSMETKVAARQAYNAMLTTLVKVPRMQYRRGMPAGSGNKPFWYSYLRPCYGSYDEYNECGEI